MISRYRVLSLSLNVRRALGLSLLALAPLAHAESPLDAVYSFQIPAQSTSDALNEFSKQSGLRLLFSYEALQGRSAPNVEGEYKAEEVLKRLLSGTDLKYEITDDAVVVVHEPGRLRPISQRREDESRVRLAQAEDYEKSSAQTAESERADQGNELPAQASGMRNELEEIIVTGSHIRGVENLSSPIIRIDRDDIERSGYATTQQLIQSLPQNLSTVSDSTSGSVNGGPGTYLTYDGAGLNLRGLGSDSTLVLVNGRRLAATGNGSFVDVSLIPLSAIERIDVLTDGASALYGSDAVGGVVNMVLREDFEGAETRVRFGSVTEGNHDEWQAAQLFGRSWQSGQALLGYEYVERSALDASDRDFIQLRGAYRSLVLIPEQRRHGALAVLSQDLSDTIELNGELFFSRRNSDSGYDIGGAMDFASDVAQYGGSLGISADVAGDWQVRLSATASQNDSQLQYTQRATGATVVEYDNESRLWSIDLAADGSIGRAPGGEMRLALGAQLRNEQFVEGFFLYPVRLEREIGAAYAEVHVPLVGTANSRRGVQRLDVTMAGRYEDYTDFGSTFNPKIGLSWAPVDGLNVRGTWGTSFKAPLLSQMNPGDVWVEVRESSFLTDSGPVTGILLNGAGVDLGPEESRNWTAGFDFSPTFVPRLSLSASYFEVEYEERVRSAFPGAYDIFGVLTDPTYDIVVTRSPNPADVDALLVHHNAICVTPEGMICDTLPLAQDVAAIVDQRLRNVAAVRTRGIDVSLRYGWSSDVGEWGVQFAGAKMLEISEQLVPKGPSTNQINDVYRPVDLRMRGGLTLSRGALDIAAFVNYTDDYRDSRPAYLAGGGTQRSTVASWTTLDVNLSYDLNEILKSRGLGQARASLSAVNLLDRDPPFVSHNYGVYFDGVNASPLGRMLSAQITVRW